MNINSNRPPESQASGCSGARNLQNIQKPAGAEQTDDAGPARNAAPSVRVDISDRSKEIADLMSAIDRLPEVRESKVREIQQRIDAGTYTVDARKVAEAILKHL